MSSTEEEPESQNPPKEPGRKKSIWSQEKIDRADLILTHLYIIRDRLANLEQRAANLAAKAGMEVH